MAVRSLELGHVKATSTLQSFYTVPAGRTAILKSLVIGKGATGSAVCTITVLRGANAYFVAVVSLSNLGGQATQIDRWMVFEPGDVLRAITDGLTVDVWASGAELLGIA